MSVEFNATTTPRNVTLSFCVGKELVRLVIPHCGRDVPVVRNNVALVARLLSVTSLEATNINCGGCTSDFNKSLDKNLNRKARARCPFSLSPVKVEKVAAQTIFSVVWRIDMFCILQIILARLSGLLDERWVQSKHFLKSVGTCCAY